MKAFFFCFEVEPTSAAPRASDIAGADAHMFVMADSLEMGEVKARAYLMDYAWLVKKVEAAREMPPSRIAGLDTIESALHRKAQREGVAAMFFAWPKREGQDDDSAELRSLWPPRGTDSGKH